MFLDAFVIRLIDCRVGRGRVVGDGIVDSAEGRQQSKMITIQL